MKKLMLIMVAAATIFTAKAGDYKLFNVGLKAGVNTSSVSFDGDYSNWRAGFTGGFALEIRPLKMLSVSADVLYSRLGWKDNEFDANVASDYISVPVMVNFYIVRGLAVKAGLQTSFLVSSFSKQDGEKVSLKDEFTKAELSIPVGLSYQFGLGLRLEARYHFGVTNISKSVGEVLSGSLKNNYFSLTVGWNF